MSEVESVNNVHRFFGLSLNTLRPRGGVNEGSKRLPAYEGEKLTQMLRSSTPFLDTSWKLELNLHL